MSLALLIGLIWAFVLLKCAAQSISVSSSLFISHYYYPVGLVFAVKCYFAMLDFCLESLKTAV